MLKFATFLDSISRKNKKQLKIIENILSSSGLQVKANLDNNDPYLYVSVDNGVSFQGIRIYKIGESLAFRVQRENETHPYGKAYKLCLEEFFTDLVSDHINPEKAGKKTADHIVNEIKRFFTQSRDAEDRVAGLDNMNNSDPLGRIVITTNTPEDYANMAF